MHVNYVSRANLVCAHRRLFATSNGRIGLGPATLEVGDKICVLLGGEVLYVLRRTGDGNLIHGQEQQGVQGKQPSHVQEKFSLIGQVYVRGLMYLMHGEAFTADSRGPESKLVIV
jgi:hypothetical protein